MIDFVFKPPETRDESIKSIVVDNIIKAMTMILLEHKHYARRLSITLLCKLLQTVVNL
jgi:hypothetical protein